MGSVLDEGEKRSGDALQQRFNVIVIALSAMDDLVV